MERLKSQVRLLMPIPYAFAVARGFSRLAIGAGLQDELWPGDLCTPPLRALFGTGKRRGAADAVGKPQV